ncbi:single-stranded DNA-binding protein [Amylolactobacillus amylotrophicus DSM 20534]|uniref:Single-stranded DNA-binding protein n=3 Tax=Amylolactobacillus TaxID=2767876 RepID=A0A0R1YMR5_9LACO|nr:MULTISPECIES: single-stranded DNA-binding protein [Amylolactobacillus]APT18496.1 single-stranded DNA-binding protein [Amylolactobacillus amylophilus DSM 20533 = JCM 1125]KRK37557.1 single-stranded DNA-binding protein [Amylolactobacillus amylotrophicus DSM 20534]KRM43533.1 single-stranded DNA-binding protein [Amylolactobacillus amylophilus DSM 20533 = JCM 1125]GED80376.1 single-stranded DNA-binding protein [Amylolactobacillus amylophilus]
MINRVVLVGRLTRDPDLRTTGSGVSVATFTLAVNRQFTNAQGEREADFVNCVIWRKSAENFSNFTRKGSLVGVEGRIQTRSYDNNEGQRVYVTEVVVDNFSLLESRSQTESRRSGENNFNGNSNQSFGNNGFNNQGQTPTNSAPKADDSKPIDPFADSGSTIDISDDDLPF